MSFGPSYLLVTPVQDEVVFIDRTLESVAQQTWRLLPWVIVDEGSIGKTDIILGASQLRRLSGFDHAHLIHVSQRKGR